MNQQPFYAAQGKVAGSSRTYELRYFRSEEEAQSDAAQVPGSYVVRTSPAPHPIWRSTRPAQEV